MASKKDIAENSIKPEAYFEVSLDTFLYNAGIVGFIQVLKASGAKKDEDYFINGQILKVCKIFLLNADLAQGYIDAVCEKFKKDTFFEKIKTNDKIYKAELSKINTQYKMIDEKTREIKGGKYRQGIGKIGVLQKKDYETELKQLDDNCRLEKIKEILKDVEKDSVASSILNFSSVTDKIAAFWRQFAFLDYSNTSSYSLTLIMEKYFTNAIKNMIAYKKNSEKIHDCFMCPNEIYKDYSYETLGQKKRMGEGEINKKYYNTSFVNGLSKDLTDKSSHFWNFKPDVYLCPLCAFIHACIPLGFLDITDSTYVFINRSDNIQNMIDEIDGYKSILSLNKTSDYFYNYIESKIKKNSLDISGVEFIINTKIGKSDNWYTIRNVDKNILKLLNIKGVSRKLEQLSFSQFSKRYEISKDEGLKIFDECIKNIFDNISMYNLIFKIFKLFNRDTQSFLREEKQKVVVYDIWNILLLQITRRIIFQGGINVKDRKKILELAMQEGRILRSILNSEKDYKSLKEITDDDEKKKVYNEIEKSTRGLVFQLVNFVHNGNRNLFLRQVLQLYVSLDSKIPNSFYHIFDNTDDFKEIGYAFLLGLKGCNDIKDKEQGDENE